MMICNHTQAEEKDKYCRDCGVLMNSLEGHTKKCPMCGKRKEISEYYELPPPYSRPYTKCKKCLNEFNRLRKLKNYDPKKEKERAARRSAAKTREYSERMYKKYSEKMKTRSLTRYAIKKGIIKRLPCRDCGVEKVEAHHPDYSDHLNVIWLCKKHHAFLHRKPSSTP